MVKVLHIAFELWGSLFCLIAAVGIGLARIGDGAKRRILMVLQFSTCLLLLMDVLAWAFRGYPGSMGYYMVRISNFVVFLVSDVITVLFHSYVCSYVFPGKKWREMSAAAKLIYLVGAAGIFLVIFSQFTDLYYYFDDANFYHRSQMWILSVVPAAIAAVVDVYLILKHRKNIKRGMTLAMLSYMFLPCAALIVQSFVYGVSFINIAINISMILIFIAALAEQGKNIYELKTGLLLSQMHPHFIYNTLGAIRYLCKKDTQGATELIDEFAKYLRRNMDALTAKEAIPFERELEHVKSYVAIEKKRFGKRLNVVYELEVTDFLVPALSLQPIVENAVKHGVTKNIDGGTIHISTRYRERGFVIRVTDDGPGFVWEQTQKKDGRSHIGISNVSTRLEEMCGGKLTIRSVPGKGTEAEIYLPEKKQKKSRFY